RTRRLRPRQPTRESDAGRVSPSWTHFSLTAGDANVLHRVARRGTLPRMAHAPVTRREFLQALATTAAVPPLLSVRPRAAAPMLRHASIGASGQAFSDIAAFAKHPAFDLVAVADVDLARFERVQQRFPRVRVYQDWRELLEKEHAHIDSVNVSTPDHMHCVIA